MQGSQPTRLEEKAEHIGLSESAFLAKEADHARKAISATVAKIKADLTGAADVRPVVESYPWVALGAAAVAGFVGGAMVVKSRKEKAIERLAILEKAMSIAAGERSTVRGAAVADGAARNPRAGRGFAAKMFDELVKPAIMSAITSHVTAKKTTETVQENTPPGGANGAGGEAGQQQYS